MALEPKKSSSNAFENFEKLQKLSEASRAFIKEAIDIEDSLMNNADSLVRNDEIFMKDQIDIWKLCIFQALLHYEEGLRLLDQALGIEIPDQDVENEEENDSKSSSDLVKAHKTRTKMSRTRQQVVFRIHELKSKIAKKESANDEPTFENNNKDDFVIEMELQDALNESMNQSSMTVPSDAIILFTIAGQVQIFYINKDGHVSAPSYPSSLFIFKFQVE